MHSPAQSIADTILTKLQLLPPIDAARLFLSIVKPLSGDPFRSAPFRDLALMLAGSINDGGIAAELRGWALEVSAELEDPSLTPIFTPISGTVLHLLELNRPADAEKVCLHYLDQHPGDADAFWLLSMCLGKQNKPKDVLSAQVRSLQLHSTASRCASHASDLNQAGIAAVEVMERAHLSRPDDMRILCELAGHYHQVGDTQAALADATEALERSDNPKVQAKAHLLIAASLCDGSASCLWHIRKAVELAPHWHFARLVLGEELIRAGDWTEGWKHYQAEAAARQEPAAIGAAPEPFTPAKLEGPPLWNGEDLTGKFVTVRAWGGFGDQIQFARFAVELARRGGLGQRTFVRLLCRPELFDLFCSLPQLGNLAIAQQPEDSGNYQLYPYMLPMILGMTPETVSGKPYLRSNPAPATRLPSSIGQFKIGIAWSGNPAFCGDRERSADVRDFSALATLPDVFVTNAQPCTTKVDFLMWTNLGLRDFAATAALIDQLDLVISVDTAVAHLAGAMGKPVWLLLPHQGEWRWGTDPTRTVWYDSMRLFRQEKPGDWRGVMERAREEVRRLVAPCQRTLPPAPVCAAQP